MGRRLPRAVLVLGLVVSFSVTAEVAHASSNCGTSGSRMICVAIPDGPLAGNVPVTVTNSPNSGTVTASWVPSGKSPITLITDFAPSPLTNDYSFVWPTHKYLDASGTLKVQASNVSASVSTILSNGNLTDFQHSLPDWANFLPNPSWTTTRDPIVAAVGDGASDEPVPNDNAQSIAASLPDLFLYLGDIYDNGTFTENLNHYGQNSMDGGAGTLWGAMGTITQPTLGDHEDPAAWRDYFHQRPNYTSFLFANVLFLDLSSTADSMIKGSAQYNWVQSVLQSNTAPCVISYFQNPVINKNGVVAKRTDMWKLLTDNGGDLVLAGNSHNMDQYKPLNDQLALPSPNDPTMVELIAGSGGHALSKQFPPDPKLEWSKGKTAGALFITPQGAASGGTPSTLSWSYKSTSGTVVQTGTRDCGGGPPPPPGPVISNFTPTSGPVGTNVTINGSGFTGTTDVSFNATPSTSFQVVSDSQITATVPSGVTTGRISVTAGGTTAMSSSDFTVTTGQPGTLLGSSLGSGPCGSSTATSGVTPSISPTTSVVFLWVTTVNSTGGPSTVTSVSGLSGTWTVYDSVVSSNGNRRLTLIYGTGVSGSGALTVNYSAATDSSTRQCVMDEFTGGIDTTNPIVSGTVKKANPPVSSTSIKVTPSALASAGNAFYVGVNHRTAEPVTPYNPSATTITDANASNAQRASTNYLDNYASGDMGGGWTTSTSNTVALGVEIAAAP